jgi:serine/threonine-protein kinase
MPYLVMELLRGQDLGSLLETRGRLDAADVLVYLRQTALALDKTHVNGIIHRDLKPENLFLTTLDDGSPHIKVLDFGIAKVVSQSGMFKTTRNIGTPLYMSPEQIRGDGNIGTASDRYACGHIAFTLLVGQSYWTPEATTLSAAAALLVRVLQGKPEPATLRARALGVELPHGFDAWFDRATAADPAQRFESLRAQIDSLAAVFDQARVSWGTPHVIAVSSQAHARESQDVGAQPDKSMSGRSSPRTARSVGLLALMVTALCLLVAWAIRHRARPIPTSDSQQPASRVVDRGPVEVTANAIREIAPKPADPVSSASSATPASGKVDSTKPPTTLSRTRREPARPTPASPPNFDPTDIR